MTVSAKSSVAKGSDANSKPVPQVKVGKTQLIQKRAKTGSSGPLPSGALKGKESKALPNMKKAKGTGKAGSLASVAMKPIGALMGKARKAQRNKNKANTANTGPLPAVGEIVSGTVKSSGKQGIILSLVSGQDARVKLSEISTRFISGDEVAALFPPKTKLEGMSVSEVSATGAIELKLKSKVGEPELGSVHKAVVKRVEKYGVLMGFSNSLARCLCETGQVDDDEANCKAVLSRIQPGHKYTVKVIRIENGRFWVTMKKSQLGEHASEVLEEPQMEFPADTPVAAPAQLIEEELFTVDPPNHEARKRAVDALEGDDDEKETADWPTQLNAKKKAKREKESKKRQEESKIREKENAVLSGEWKKDPQTPEEFERLVLAEGTNFSTVWIKYMSYWLKMTELGKAREVAERALKQASLSFSDEQEKFNLWIAYLNMEAAFGGSPDQLFSRAAQYCDLKKIHHAMPQVYVRSGQLEKAEAAFEKMTAKFPLCRKAWINLIEFHFTQTLNLESARSAFQRAIKSLPQHKQTRATVKFAQLEFRSGNAERGSTLFEKLLQKNANKTDIWSVYFDETIKAFHSQQPDAVRELFEKALSTKLKPFKMKFFFKRYLEFEQQHGSDESVESVKNKAVAYVDSIAE